MVGNVCPRLSKCFCTERANERLTFPKSPQTKAFPYESYGKNKNYSHSSISRGENYFQLYSEMKDQFRRPILFPPYYDTESREYVLKNFSWKPSPKGKFSELPKDSEKQYYTEYRANFQNQNQNTKKISKHELTRGRSDITTFYTDKMSYNKKKNILDPFKKHCYFTRPLSERLENTWEL